MADSRSLPDFRDGGRFYPGPPHPQGVGLRSHYADRPAALLWVARHFPIFPALYALYEGNSPSYQSNPDHLWFLQNLVSYTVLLLPLIVYVKRRPDNFEYELNKFRVLWIF